MGIKKNIVYSSILTVSGYLFPLLTFPYVTRILGVENIGICNFYDGVTNYFILFGMLGIVNLGIREIAKCNGDINRLNNTFSSLFTLNLIATIISIFIFIIIGLTVDKIGNNPSMVIIGISKVLANCMLIEWLFKGLEDFKYITLRTLIVRLSYVISIFIFVRAKDDYIIYFALTTSMFIINAFVNLYMGRKIVKIRLSFTKIKPYIKPFFTLGLYQILTSMYTTFNVVYLGFVSSDTEVGYYATATKLYTIILSFYTAFTGVMLPRMSALLSQNKFEEFKAYIRESSKFLYLFSIPLILLSITFAPVIVNIIAGHGYEGAILPMRIIMPLMLIIGLEQVLVYQVLFPLNDDKAILVNSVIGASVGITFNVLLVGHLLAIGSAISWVASEISVLLTAYWFIKKRIKISIDSNFLIKILFFSIPLAIFAWVFKWFENTSIVFAVSVSSCVLLYYFIIGTFVLKATSLTKIVNRIHKL